VSAVPAHSFYYRCSKLSEIVSNFISLSERSLKLVTDAGNASRTDGVNVDWKPQVTKDVIVACSGTSIELQAVCSSCEQISLARADSDVNAALSIKRPDVRDELLVIIVVA